jgi:flagellar biosynthesis GTPase FlhF
MDVVKVRKNAADIGVNLGLTGQELVDFVRECVADAKAEADATRKEHALAKKEAESARKEKEAEAARKEKEAETAAARQHELDKMKLEHEHAAQMASLEDKQNPESSFSNPFSGVFGPQIQLPKFNEERDNFDAFVARFESVAKNQKWPTDQ